MEYVQKPLVQISGTYYVPVSHEEINSLVGRLMQMCDLTGDIEQRTALKSTIKQQSRQWLDDLYYSSGYQNHEVIAGSKIIK